MQVVQAAAAGRSAFSPAVLAKLREPLAAEAQEAPLNDQERQILWLICEEKSNAEIAAALYTSQKSVERRLTALFRKLGVRTRVGAAVWFTQYETKKGRPAEW